MATVLADGQWELDGAVLFGNGTLIRVQQVSWDPGAPAVQDAPVAQGDGVRMGVDTLPGMILSVTGIITAGNGQGGAALDLYELLAAAWMNEDVRAVPGAVSVLRVRYPGSAGTRAVLGRGRKIAPTLGQVRQGLLGWTADFASISPWFYADADSTLVLTMMPSDIGGVANVHNRLLNATFDADATQWQGTNCALAWGASPAHAAPGALRVTPAGAVPGVFASGNCDLSDACRQGRAVTWAVWAYAPGTLSVQVQAAVAWLNAASTVVGTAAGPLTTLAPATWTLLSAGGVPPATAVTLDPRLVYAGSPAAADVVWLDDAALTENLGGIAPPVTPPVTLGGTADAANTAAVPAAPAGTAGRAAWPVFTITGPVTNPQVTYATGQYVRLQTAIPAGVTATIDTRPWVRAVTRSDGASLAGAARGSLLRDMALQPGATAIRFAGQDNTGTARLTVTWRAPTGTIGGST